MADYPILPYGLGIVASVVLATGLSGCADRTLIRSEPTGAKVFINEQYVGITPLEYSAPRSEFSQHTKYRLELTRYRTAEGELQTHVYPGRIVGGVFTLGIVPIFKRPRTYDKVHDVALTPETVVAPAPPSGLIQPSPAANLQESKGSRAVRDRLERVKRLFDEGVLTEEEYRNARQEILRDL